ncbi:hypothetical protein K2173_016064 [Erythroxylum novogranatense]|uniref:Hydroxyproline-rich glycoprotein family protein n=1 Tax=Erythroxylum novogranatense TaxID=1862640 RepID=A0AAV8SFD8_9ROSI|nr:hypothetical protein K2173_016064 [Erythroxylum novogranatense]
MRGRSSKNGTEEGMKIDKLSKQNEEPHLSGAYIRSLVKQLTSSRTKDSMNPKDKSFNDSDGVSGQNMTKFGEDISGNQQSKQTKQPQPQKKQARRRLSTNRPYQERLLNMAEARREIVTALKFHRAAMKQANEQQQQQQQVEQGSSMQVSPPCFEQEGKIKSRRNSRTYPSSTSNFSSYLEELSYPSVSHPSPSPPPPLPPYGFCWPTSANLPSVVPETLNFSLPNQPLGLNLNLHDFKNIDTSVYRSNVHLPSMYSSLSPSSSSSPPLSNVTEEAPSIMKQQVVPTAGSDMTDSFGVGGLHQEMDDEEMAEIRSIGEQHQMEWNDTMNLVTSAWWFKFLKTMELSPEAKADDDEYYPFDQVMEFPAWLNTNDGCLQQHFNDYCSQDYLNDPALPCMDIGEIEGMDGDWLS